MKQQTCRTHLEGVQKETANTEGLAYISYRQARTLKTSLLNSRAFSHQIQALTRKKAHS